VGTLGTLSKTLITGPGINNFDVSIFSKRLVNYPFAGGWRYGILGG